MVCHTRISEHPCPCCDEIAPDQITVTIEPYEIQEPAERYPWWYTPLYVLFGFLAFFVWVVFIRFTVWVGDAVWP